MTNKMITGKLRTQTNRNGSVQKIVTIPKQQQTKDWSNGDLILMERLEFKEDSEGKVE